MFARPTVVRRRPLLRAAAVGGTFAAGRAMGRRAEQRAGTQQAGTQQAGTQRASPPAPGAAPSASVLDQLSQLTALHQQGSLTDDEFAAAKAKLLQQ